MAFLQGKFSCPKIGRRGQHKRYHATHLFTQPRPIGQHPEWLYHRSHIHPVNPYYRYHHFFHYLFIHQASSPKSSENKKTDLQCKPVS